MAFIYAGIDLGNTSTGIVAKFVRVGESLETTVIEVVLLPGSRNHQDVEAPHTAVYCNGVLVYGKSVKGVTVERPDSQDDALQFYKLALHPSFKHFPEVAHVHRFLRARKNRGALHNLFTDLFRAFKRDILAYGRLYRLQQRSTGLSNQRSSDVGRQTKRHNPQCGQESRNPEGRASRGVFVCCHCSYGRTTPEAGNPGRSMPSLVGHWWRHD